jgi:tetratricopeptide (TPR) repeat protein
VRRGATLGLVVAFAVAAGAQVHAQPAGNPKAEAEKRFKQAEALYKRADYLAAAAEYQAAYDLSGLPGLLYNVAQSYRLGGEKEKAVAAYRLFLEKAPDHQLATVARGHLEALERELAAARPDEPAPMKPAREPRSDVVATAPAAPSRGRGLRVAGLVTAGVGLVALGAALHYGIEARKASDAISDNEEAWSRSLLDRYDEGESAETKMFVLSGAGAAALLTGGVLYYLGRRAEASVGAVPATGGAQVTLSGRF